MSDWGQTPNSELLSRSNQGSTDATLELLQRNHETAAKIAAERSAASSVGGGGVRGYTASESPSAELPASVNGAIAVLIVALFLVTMVFAYSAAVEGTAHGRPFAVTMLEWAFSALALLFLLYVAIFTVARFCMQHKILSVMLLSGGLWWLYHHFRAPSTIPAVAQPVAARMPPTKVSKTHQRKRPTHTSAP